MVIIEQIKQIGADERGATFVFDNDRTSEFIVAHRKAGSVSGRQFHKGISATKDPEQLVLMSGKATLNWKELVEENGAIKVAQEGSVEVIAPAKILIPKMFWHELIGVEDFVMLELNSIAEQAKDTFRL
jgi:dTDP-4-dehydrorhamnose 3,5-epimerase-like enzyme